MKPQDPSVRNAPSSAQARLVNPQWQAAVPLFSWGGLLSPFFWLVLGIAFFIALLLPEPVARDSEEAQRFASMARSALLSISRYADINAHASSTAFPHVALLSHAWMWTGMAGLLMFNTIASLINWRYWMEWFEVRRFGSLTKLKRRDIVFGLTINLLGPPVFSMLPGSSSLFGDADLSSRIFFAFLTGTFLFIWQGITYAWLPAIHTIIARTLRRDK